MLSHLDRQMTSHSLLTSTKRLYCVDLSLCTWYYHRIHTLCFKGRVYSVYIRPFQTISHDCRCTVKRCSDEDHTSITSRRVGEADNIDQVLHCSYLGHQEEDFLRKIAYTCVVCHTALNQADLHNNTERILCLLN